MKISKKLFTLLLPSKIANATLSLKESNANNKGYVELDLQIIDDLLMTTLQIGSSKENIQVLVDTGSADLWFPGTGCEGCISSDAAIDSDISVDCLKYGIFDPASSKTLQLNETYFETTFIDGTTATSEWAADEVFINNKTLGFINFGIANETENPFGTLGIGLSTLEATNFLDDPYQYDNFPMKLKRNGLISSNSYSIYKGDKTTGKLLFGAIDHDKYTGHMYKFPMINNYLLASNSTLEAIAVTLNGLSYISGEKETVLQTGYFPAILDTGSQASRLPVSLINQIKQLLNLTCNTSTGICSTQCSLLSEKLIRFDLQGVNYDIPISNFFLEIEDTDICGLAISSANFAAYITLGESFFSNIYTIFDLDNKEVGLATINESPESRNIELITDGIPSAMNPPQTETYDLQHMLHSTKSFSTSLIQSSINYSTVYVRSIRTVSDDNYLSSTTNSPYTPVSTSRSEVSTITHSSANNGNSMGCVKYSFSFLLSVTIMTVFYL